MLEIPEHMPRRGSRVLKMLGHILLRCSGWKLTGRIPNEKKLLIAAAPHTSNWDFFVGIPILLAYDVRIVILMKQEAFIWPFGRLWKWLGFVPIDRKSGNGIVDSAIDYYQQGDIFWLLMTPEGTRKHVKRWKTGFLRIANQAQVPILTMAWDYPSKTLHFGELMHSSGDYERELQALQHYFSQFHGKRKISDN
jgi:1-acyl-sn-glycerol-3-phosphate acyltransferase